MTTLGKYTLTYSGGFFVGQTPPPRTFAALGVVAAKVVMVAGGDDYAEITVDASLTDVGMPFLPLAKHTLADGNGNVRFVGWLTSPARRGDATNQQQTFRLEGPNYLLSNTVYKQPWNFAVDPTNYSSGLSPQKIARVILNLQDFGTGERVNVAAQIEAILSYCQNPGGGTLATPAFSYGSLAAIPACQPPEDEQVDMYCQMLLQRQLRWVPTVTAWWSYPSSGQPQLNFSAYAAVASLGQSATGTYILDLKSHLFTRFGSVPRYDLLLARVHIDYQGESEVADPGANDDSGMRKLWVTLATEESIADNGSPRELVLSIDLRGAGGARDPSTGLLATPQEATPNGLADAIHAPFKQLTHTLSWERAGADVDWVTTLGLAVGVKNAGDDALLGSRSIIQQITRDLATGTTSYQAGPPAQLGFDDIRALTRFSRTRNAARNSGGNGGQYSTGGGPEQKTHGTKPPPPPVTSNSNGLSALWWNVAVNGLPAFAQFSSTTPVNDLPAGAAPVNTD